MAGSTKNAAKAVTVAEASTAPQSAAKIAAKAEDAAVSTGSAAKGAAKAEAATTESGASGASIVRQTTAAEGGSGAVTATAKDVAAGAIRGERAAAKAGVTEVGANNPLAKNGRPGKRELPGETAARRAEKAEAVKQRKAAGKKRALELPATKKVADPIATEVFEVNGVKYGRVDARNGKFVEGKISELPNASKLRRGERTKLTVVSDLREVLKANRKFNDNVLVVVKDPQGIYNIVVGNNRFRAMESVGYKGPYQIVEVQLPFRAFYNLSDLNPFT